MRFADEEIARVRTNSDLVSIVSETAEPKRVGQRWMVSCPFHDDRTPSLSINAHDGLWMCFGCHAGGDTIDWVQRLHGLDFGDAVEWLARRAGLTITTTDDSDASTSRATLFDLVAAAASWYHTKLLSPGGSTARRYLADRGVTDELIERFQLGWAPAGWTELGAELDTKAELLVDAGLGRINRANRCQDFFRNRLMFPISDSGGRPVGFGARLLPGADGPKYINSPDGPIYTKSQALYGLDLAKQHVVQADMVVICEGYLDVLGCVAAGVDAAVASCGTALTEHHVTTLARFTRRMVLAFDADTAGQRAAARMHQWEADHRLDLAVATLPAGDDPGSLGFHHPTKLRSAFDDAIPFLQFRLDQVLDDEGTTIESRARCARRACEIIADHPDPMVRDNYLGQIAQRLDLNLDTLRTVAADVSPANQPGPGPQVARQAPDGPLTDLPSLELEALQAAFQQRPEHPPWLAAHLFTHPSTRDAAQALQDGLDVVQALEEAEPATRAVLVAMGAAPDPPGTGPEIGARLVEARTRAAIETLSSQSTIDIDLMTQYQRHLHELRSPQTRPAAISALVSMLAPG